MSGRDAYGRFAEGLAAALLRLGGYRILARRWRSPVGEIDLVARRRGRLAFVEVKARRHADEALRSITPAQRRRIGRAADAFLAQRPQKGIQEIGFDVFSVGWAGLPRFLRDAWRIDERL